MGIPRGGGRGWIGGKYLCMGSEQKQVLLRYIGKEGGAKRLKQKNIIKKKRLAKSLFFSWGKREDKWEKGGIVNSPTSQLSEPSIGGGIRTIKSPPRERPMVAAEKKASEEGT